MRIVDASRFLPQKKDHGPFVPMYTWILYDLIINYYIVELLNIT